MTGPSRLAVRTRQGVPPRLCQYPVMKRLCVFCGSSVGANSAYSEAATALGTLLATKGIGLVYGGGNVGLMGVIADAALAGGGEVIGVIPRALVTTQSPS